MFEKLKNLTKNIVSKSFGQVGASGCLSFSGRLNNLQSFSEFFFLLHFEEVEMQNMTIIRIEPLTQKNTIHSNLEISQIGIFTSARRISQLTIVSSIPSFSIHTRQSCFNLDITFDDSGNSLKKYNA